MARKYTPLVKQGYAFAGKLIAGRSLLRGNFNGDNYLKSSRPQNGFDAINLRGQVSQLSGGNVNAYAPLTVFAFSPRGTCCMN